MDTSILGRPVRVVKEVPVYAFAGGWGDGWIVLHPGALLRMEGRDAKEPELLIFASGPEPIGPRGTGRTGGLVHISRLDSFVDLSPIISRIVEVLGEDQAWKWIPTPCKALGGKTPRNLLGDEAGHQQIEIVLGRIEHG